MHKNLYPKTLFIKEVVLIQQDQESGEQIKLLSKSTISKIVETSIFWKQANRSQKL